MLYSRQDILMVYIYGYVCRVKMGKYGYHASCKLVTNIRADFGKNEEKYCQKGMLFYSSGESKGMLIMLVVGEGAICPLSTVKCELKVFNCTG